MKKKNEVKLTINTDWCKGCGICVVFCPKQVLEMNQKDQAEVVRLDDCIACLMCELRCPDLAIDVLTTQTQAECTS